VILKILVFRKSLHYKQHYKHYKSIQVKLGLAVSDKKIILRKLE
jgi:hypothetical protein